MIKINILFASLIFFSMVAYSQEAVYKLSSEYEIKIDISFRGSDFSSSSTLDFSKSKSQNSGSASYLSIYFKLTVSNDETRLKIEQNGKIRSRKVKVNVQEKIEMGFTDALKTEDKPQLVLHLLNEQKAEVSKIIVTIDPDGTFLINGERRGKF
jgi:hypothetical protein